MVLGYDRELQLHNNAEEHSKPLKASVISKCQKFLEATCPIHKIHNLVKSYEILRSYFSHFPGQKYHLCEQATVQEQTGSLRSRGYYSHSQGVKDGEETEKESNALNLTTKEKKDELTLEPKSPKLSMLPESRNSNRNPNSSTGSQKGLKHLNQCYYVVSLWVKRSSLNNLVQVKKSSRTG